MIKRIKSFGNNALIRGKEFREYAQNIESEILRGISTLSILQIIKSYGDEGTYGYQILQDLRQETNDMLILEEGTLYPMLKKLEKEGIVAGERRMSSPRRRKYYYLTDHGFGIYQHLSGFFSKLMEAIGPLFDMDIDIEKEEFIYCPNCANKISVQDTDKSFCAVCGFNIHDRILNANEGGN